MEEEDKRFFEAIKRFRNKDEWAEGEWDEGNWDSVHREILLKIVANSRSLEILNESRSHLATLLAISSLLIAIAALGVTISASADDDLGYHIIGIIFLIVAMIGCIIFAVHLFKRSIKIKRLTRRK